MKKIRIILSLLIMMFAFSLVCLNTKVDAAGAQSTVYDESLEDEAKVDYDLSRIHVGENKISSFPVTTKSVYGCAIEWSVDEEYKNVLDASYVKETGYILLTRPESLENNETEVKAKLKLTVSKGDVSKTKEFDIVVPVGKTITQKITITFNVDGVDPYQNVSVGTNQQLPNPKKEGFIFKGWYEENDTNYEGRCYTTTLGILKDITLSAKWEKATLTTLSVKSDPTKTVYTALEEFDSTGLILTATYSDGSTKDVSEGYSVDKTVLHGNDKEVTVSYEGKKVSVTITVNKIKMTDVEYKEKTVTYNGREQYIEVTGTLPEWIEVTYEKKEDAGEHTVCAYFNLKEGYSSDDYEVPEAKSTTLTIEKATPDVRVTFNGTYYVGHSAPEFVRDTTYTAKFNGTNVPGTMKWDVVEGFKLSENNVLTWTFTPESSNFKTVTSRANIKATNASLVSIEISKGYRETYTALETFDPGTAKITFKYSDESTVTENLKDVKYSVSYCDGKTDCFDLNESNCDKVVIKYAVDENNLFSYEINGLTINAKEYDFSGFSASNKTVTFDGRKHFLDFSYSGDLLSITEKIKLQGSSDVCEDGALNVGVYDVTLSFEINDLNYNKPVDKNYTLTIEAKSIEDENVIVDSVASQEVDSRSFDAVTPNLTIKYNVSKNEVLSLVKDTDFTVVYSNNTSISSGTSVTATVTITGKGNYAGTKTIEFTIELSKEFKFNEDVSKFNEIYNNGVDTDETALVDVSLPNGSTVEWTSKSTAVEVDKNGNISVTRTENIQNITVIATITNGNHTQDIEVKFCISEKKEEVINKIATLMTQDDLNALIKSGEEAKIFIGSKNYVMGTVNSSNSSKNTYYFNNISCLIDKNCILSYYDGAAIITLKYSTTYKNWILKLGDKYLYASGNKMFSLCEEEDYSQWSITINYNEIKEIYEYEIKYAYSTGTEYGRLLYNVSSPRFTIYNSSTSTSDTMLLPQIYLCDSSVTTYSVLFDSNGGTAVSSQYVGKGGTISEPTAPTKDDHTFDGWYLDSAYTTKFDFNNGIIENTTLYAKWKEIEKVNITYKIDNVQYGEVVKVNAGTQLSSLPSPTNHGYTLNGWYLDDEYQDKVSTPYTVNDDITLFAKWVKLNTYNVEFIIDGERVKTLVDYEVEESDCPTLTETGFTLDGWYSDDGCTNKVEFPYSVTDNVSFYAKKVESGSSSSTTKKFVKVTSDQDDWSGEYLIVYEKSSFAFDGSLTSLDDVGNYVDVTIDNSSIAYSDDLKTKTFVIDKVNNSYTIKSKSGYYIGRTASSNGFDSSKSSSYNHTIEYSSGSISIKSSGGPKLQFYSATGSSRFRYYKTTQNSITLYKLTTSN